MLITDNLIAEASNIEITSLSEATKDFYLFDAVITIEDASCDYGLRIEDVKKTPQLVLKFDDIDSACKGYQAVEDEHVIQAVEFARNYTAGMLLVHCHAGQCRSPAIALAVLADRLGEGHEREAVEQLLKIRRWATPNLLVIAAADRVLNRNGSLIKAWNEHGFKVHMIKGIQMIKNSVIQSKP